MSIPRLIHQIWIEPRPGYGAPPPSVADNMRRWQELHADYIHICWSISSLHQTFAQSEHKEAIEALDACNIPAMQADVARLLLLRHFGGFWIDLKTQPRKAFLDELLKFEAVFVEHHPSPKLPNPHRFLINSFIGCVPEQSIVSSCFSKVIENIHSRMRGSVFDVTGAPWLTRSLSEITQTDTTDIAMNVRVIKQDQAWNALLAIGDAPYNRDGNHWTSRQQHESLYCDDSSKLQSSSPGAAKRKPIPDQKVPEERL